MLSKRTVILAKVEDTYGSDPTLTAASNAIEAYDLEVPSINADMKERAPGNSDLSRFPEIRGKTSYDWKLKTLLRGSGTLGTAPRTSPLLQSAGLGETIVSGASVTYAPLSSSLKSCTIEAYVDGILMQLLGCVSDLEMDFTAGELPWMSFAGKGIYTIPTDSAIVDPTFDTTVPQVVKGVTMTFGSYAAIIEKMTLKMGNKIAERPDFNQTEGIKGFEITDRNPEGSITVEAVLRAETNADFLSYFHSRTVKALSFVIGATEGNIATITAPYCYLRPPGVGDREGVRTFEIPFHMGRSSGNDEN